MKSHLRNSNGFELHELRDLAEFIKALRQL